MAKTLVLCCDGTANEFARDRTNVIKLYYALARDPAQVTYYHPGVGTAPAVGALTYAGKTLSKLAGLAFGAGLDDDVRDAYIFLLNNFEDGDRVFLFGFSRGAYTVRALCSLLYMYGLIPRGNEPFVPYAVRMLRSVDGRSAPEAFALARAFRNTFSTRDCHPYFVGVWDTVSSVGWVGHPLKLPYSANNPDIAIGRHAMAIDERRAFFRSNLWHPGPPSPEQPQGGGPRDLKQVWFPGVHCDVGGGYKEADSGLSKLALEWMLGEAQEKGLRLDRSRTEEVLGLNGNGYAAPDVDGPMHESLTWTWWPAEFVPKPHYDWRTGHTEHRMNLFRRRTVPPGALVHTSVFQRRGYRPALPTNVATAATRPLSWA